MALTGEISDALAVIGLLRADHYLRSGRSLDADRALVPGPRPPRLSGPSALGPAASPVRRRR